MSAERFKTVCPCGVLLFDGPLSPEGRVSHGTCQACADAFRASARAFLSAAALATDPARAVPTC